MLTRSQLTIKSGFVDTSTREREREREREIANHRNNRYVVRSTNKLNYLIYIKAEYQRYRLCYFPTLIGSSERTENNLLQVADTEIPQLDCDVIPRLPTSAVGHS
jgi:hypothetical protein